MKITIPGFSKPTRNGVAPIATEGQRARLSDYERALRGEKTWRGVSKALGVPILALGAAVFVLAARPPSVVVYDREPDGHIHYAGTATQDIAPGDVAIDASLVSFIRGLREIPGTDFALVDRATHMVHFDMTAPGSPAEHDELAYWHDHNPKARGRDMTRLVVDRKPAPTCTRLGDSLTFDCVFAEQIRDSRNDLTTVARTATITMEHEPTLPTDTGVAIDNPGGIDVWSFSPSLVED
ncbi:MAG: VirB8/TrbF family protein [Vulcanimicrobiaceae bacterium]